MDSRSVGSRCLPIRCLPLPPDPLAPVAERIRGLLNPWSPNGIYIITPLQRDPKKQKLVTICFSSRLNTQLVFEPIRFLNPMWFWLHLVGFQIESKRIESNQHEAIARSLEAHGFGAQWSQHTDLKSGQALTRGPRIRGLQLASLGDFYGLSDIIVMTSWYNKHHVDCILTYLTLLRRHVDESLLKYMESLF